MSVDWYLARRYLWDPRQGMWGWLISGIPIVSVALGVGALIVTLAVMSGFRTDIKKRMLGIHPHLYLTAPFGKIDPRDSVLTDQLSHHSLVEDWSPYISGEILIGRGPQTAGATIKGINPKKEPFIADLEDKLKKGEWNSLDSESLGSGDKPRIFLGQELARKLGARKGDLVWTITPGSIGITTLSIPQAFQFEVMGFIETGLYDYDTIIAYVDLPEAQKLFGLGPYVTGVGIRLKNLKHLERAGKTIQKDLDSHYWVRSWISLNKNLFSALKLEKTVMFILQTLITLVASFMIISNLLLKITQKVKEIGILRAMGAPPKVIQRIFLYQGMLMGIIGNILGVFLGIGLSLVIKFTDIVKLPADVYYIGHVPVHLEWGDIGLVVLIATLIVFIATLYPARRAAQLDPLEAIRYG